MYKPYPVKYRFTCDPKKNDSNVRTHGIDLLDAAQLLCGLHIKLIDDRKDYGEERCIAKGYLFGRPVAVVYTERVDDEMHVISARRLTKNEERQLVKELAGARETDATIENEN